MFARRYQILGLQFYLHDLLLTILAFLLSYLLRNYAVILVFPRLSPLYPIQDYFPFLIGVLFGVMLTAAITFVFAIPANSDHWRMEIWKRGGAAWTFDKNGHLSWKWMVEPIPDTPQPKRVIVPSSQTNIRNEHL